MNKTTNDSTPAKSPLGDLGVMPWQNRPEGNTDIMWRYTENPIIDRYAIPSSNSIFNSAVVPFEDGFAGVFRCDNKSVQMNILPDSAPTVFIGKSTTNPSFSNPEIPK